jgi:hypothetical protein
VHVPIYYREKEGQCQGDQETVAEYDVAGCDQVGHERAEVRKNGALFAQTDVSYMIMAIRS